MSDAFLKTGDLSRKAGVNRETIRFYERKGLLRKPERSPGGYRQYGDADVQRVKFIKNAQTLGFNLKEISQLLVIADGSVIDPEDVRDITQEKLTFVRGKISALKQLESVLVALMKRCARSGEADVCPIIESIFDGWDREKIESGRNFQRILAKGDQYAG